MRDKWSIGERVMDSGMKRVILLLFILAGCAPAASTENHNKDSVWSIDLVTTMPGQQANYIQSIETNWSNARRIAKERGAIRSYRALVAPQDSTRGWDIMLMTEYSDSTEWANREATFQAIFASEEFVHIEPAAPSSEMRDFFHGGVALHAFLDE